MKAQNDDKFMCFIYLLQLRPFKQAKKKFFLKLMWRIGQALILWYPQKKIKYIFLFEGPKLF